jgi:hypothetical protein
MAVETKQVERSQTLFSTPVQTAEAMTAQVRMHLERTYPDGLPPGVDLATIALSAVEGLWQSRVKTFVPVLALRDARDMLRTASNGSA